MPEEIERKFLVRDDSWKQNVVSRVYCRQAYVRTAGEPHATVRARIMGEKAFLTLKGAARGIARSEFEYQIPVEDARVIMDELCFSGVEKYRNIVPFGGFNWEVDEFLGVNEGLVMAEIELPSCDTAFERPQWLGEEVSLRKEYRNACLAVKPFSQWGKMSG